MQIDRFAIPVRYQVGARNRQSREIFGHPPSPIAIYELDDPTVSCTILRRQ